MKAWPLPAVVAHRCGGTLAPENTLIGLDHALAHRCKAVEFDVMLSGSGTPVLMHDETLTRTTNGSGRVSETPDSVLCNLDAGSWKAPQFAGERIPRFVDALSRCAELGLAANVEIKPAAGYEVETGRIVGEYCHRQGVAQLLLLSSFSIAALLAAAEAVPQLPRALLVERLSSDWFRLAETLELDGFVCESRHLRQEQVAAVRQAGLNVAVYTENKFARAVLLRTWGVQSIITDRPDLLTCGSRLRTCLESGARARNAAN
ncbi:MAG: glycerophosphodiester phosphodiesterase [Betaproteobacteria bacterium]|nr:glycerophosphodiester phosphodiesterase [Betaproteobacteria bacterium]